MFQTLISFDLLAWSHRLARRAGKTHLTHAEAAALLGVSASGYRAIERRNRKDPEKLCNATLALLARCREEHP